MRKKIPIEKVTLGMFLVGLDKSWLATPFLRHKFTLTTQDEIEKLKAANVKVVEIDISEGLDVQEENSAEPKVLDEWTPVEREETQPLDEWGTDHGLLEEEATALETTTESVGVATGSVKDRKGTEVSTSKTVSTFLRVGTVLRVTMAVRRGETATSVSTYSRLLGWKDKYFLLCDMPYHNGRALEIRGGVPCIVRFVVNGMACGARVETIKGQFSPEPLLFLTYPKEVEELALRKEARVLANLPVTILFGDSTTDGVEATIGDLSATGCGIRWFEAEGKAQGKGTVKPETTVSLDFMLPGMGSMRGLKGTIKAVISKPQKDKIPAHLFLGVHFDRTGSAATLKGYLDRYIMDQLELIAADDQNPILL